ncbi:MAG: transcriptional regulator, TetR family [Solirubrobacterales bacterium]|nr:transcriptional regulator, TetR family [Solirubrobacterales bacterium]
MGIDRTGGEDLSPLYRRLPYGPKRIDRDEVARNQRARLYGAMMESVDRRGYRATTVAHLVALAGVSRRAFYEQFPNKEHCFLATYDIVVARERKRVTEAWKRERGWTNRLHAACGTLLEDIARDPKGPRLVLIESLALGASGRERMQLAGLTFERLLATVFRIAPDGAALPALASRAVVGGIRQVLFMRMLEDRHSELDALTDEVLDWIESYRSPAAARLLSAASPPPRQPPLVRAAFLHCEDRRARALGSLVDLTIDGGYAALTDGQIAQFAGISTEAFHQEFANKEECFLAVLDEFTGEALGAAKTALECGQSWPQAVDRAMRAFIEHLLARRALLRIAFIDLFEVGPAVSGRLATSIEALTALLTEPGPPPRRAPTLAREAVSGAIWAVLASCASGDGASRLPLLVDQLTFIVLAPYIGPKAATEAIRAGRTQARPA